MINVVSKNSVEMTKVTRKTALSSRKSKKANKMSDQWEDKANLKGGKGPPVALFMVVT